MPELILYLNATPPSSGPSEALALELDYVLQRDDFQIVAQGRAGLALLPAAPRGTDVVAVVPASAMSWHAVSLPDKVASGVLASRADPQRVRAVLSGAMEENLLDDTAKMHFAAFPGTAAGPTLWVAVCDREWLRAALIGLEMGGYTVARVVAECEPVDADAPAMAFVSAACEPAQIVLCTAAGVTVLPLSDAAVVLSKAHAELEIWAQPAAMAAAEAAFGVPVRAQTLHQSLVRAAQSVRNLAQLEFSPSKSGRARKRIGSAWQVLQHAPQWRPVRWGVLALVVLQLFALNAAAYRQQTLLAQKRAAVEAVLRQTFPDLAVIVDAPVQMQRELAVLAQSRGTADTDMARLLNALGSASAAGKSLTAIDLRGGQLRLNGNGLNDADAASVNAAISAPGWQARVQGEQMILQRRETQ